MKSGNLNFVEQSGPLPACNGTALPLPLHININYNSHRWVILLKGCSSGRKIQEPPPSTQAGYSERDAVFESSKKKQ